MLLCVQNESRISNALELVIYRMNAAPSQYDSKPLIAVNHIMQDLQMVICLLQRAPVSRLFEIVRNQ